MAPEQIAALVSLLWQAKDIGAIFGLGVVVWLLLSGRVVTRKHMDDVVAAKTEQILDAKAIGAEWRRLAQRGTDEIIVPLTTTVREQLGSQRERP